MGANGAVILLDMNIPTGPGSADTSADRSFPPSPYGSRTDRRNVRIAVITAIHCRTRNEITVVNLRRTPIVLLLLTGAIIGAACMAGCAATDPVLVVSLEGCAWYPPTDPATVEILRAEPQRPYDPLGQVVIDKEVAMPAAAVERKLRTAVARIGAHAVVILPTGSATVRTEGTAAPGGRFIYAIAIRYRD